MQTVLDPISYNVFRFKEKMVLYDVNTDSIIQVNDELTYDILDLAGKYDIADLRKQINKKHKGVGDAKIIETIKPLKDAGFFINPPVDFANLRRIKARLMKYQPDKIQLCITQACNLACIYCYAEESGSNARNQLMSFETAKQSIDYLVRGSGSQKRLSIQFFGGEPLMNFKLMKQVVEYCESISQKSDKVFSYAVSTNCTLLDEEVQDYLVKYRFGVLVSVDGDAEIHNRQRPFRDGRPSYDLVMKNAIALNEKFIKNKLRPPRIRANIINGNANRLAEITNAFSDLGFKAIGVAPIMERLGENAPFGMDDDALAKWSEQADNQFCYWLDCTENDKTVKNSYITREVHRKFGILKSKRIFGGVRCGVGRGVNIVDVDGNIYPCHRYPGMDKYIIGNVYTGIDREKISAYYDDIMNSMLKNCKDCWMRYKCGGPCPWQVSAEEGHICPSDKLSCDERKHAFRQGAYMYVRLSQNKPEALERYIKRPQKKQVCNKKNSEKCKQNCSQKDNSKNYKKKQKNKDMAVSHVK